MLIYRCQFCGMASYLGAVPPADAGEPVPVCPDHPDGPVIIVELDDVAPPVE